MAEKIKFPEWVPNVAPLGTYDGLQTITGVNFQPTTKNKELKFPIPTFHSAGKSDVINILDIKERGTTQPQLYYSLNPPGFLIDIPGAIVFMIIDVKATTDNTQFLTKNWSVDLDVAGWLNEVVQKTLETRVSGDSAIYFKTAIHGIIKRTMKPLRLTIGVDIDPGAWELGTSFVVSTALYLLSTRVVARAIAPGASSTD